MSKLDEIEARAAAATPGPWGMTICGMSVRAEDGAGLVIAEYIRPGYGEQQCNNLDFIASAPTAIAYLLRVARAAERWLPEMRREGDQFDSDSMRDAAEEIGAALEGREP